MKFYSKDDNVEAFECEVMLKPTQIEVVSNDRVDEALYPYVCVVEDDKRFVSSDNFMEEFIYMAGFCSFNGEKYKVLSTSTEGGLSRKDSMDKAIMGKIIVQLKKI